MKISNKIIALILSVITILVVCAGCSQTNDPVQVSESVDFNQNEEVTTVPAADEEEEEVKEPENIGPVSLSEEDKAVLEAMAADIVVLDDETFPDAVTELMYHVGTYTGMVYQLEGIYTEELDDEGNAYLSRTLVHDGESTVVALPLTFLTVDVAEGSWVRVTAIIGASEINGVQSTVLEVVAIENIDQGAAELAWSGSAHAHS